LNIDMIFVGDRGLGALHHLVIGSVAHKIVNLSKCTCVIVR
jgi:nucleotide-binding universal stress UspA family protein